MDVPYHNAVHASDVLSRLVAVLRHEHISQDSSLSSMCNLLAIIMATVIHDYGHPGLDNKYLVDTNSEVSRRFNQRAVLENHSVFQCLEMLRTKELNPFSGVRFNKNSLLSLVIKLVSHLTFPRHHSITVYCSCHREMTSFTATHLQVLATDMADHFFLVSDFKSKVSCCVFALYLSVLHH
jgi:hypothetical protein